MHIHISNGSCSYSRSPSNINKLKKDFQKHFLYNSPEEKKKSSNCAFGKLHRVEKQLGI